MSRGAKRGDIFAPLKGIKSVIEELLNFTQQTCSITSEISGAYLYSGDAQVPSNQDASIYKPGDPRIFYLWVIPVLFMI